MLAQMPGTYKQFEVPKEDRNALYWANRLAFGEQSVGYHDPELTARFNTPK